MGKHTPGPWKVVKGTNGRCDTWQVVHDTPPLCFMVAECGTYATKEHPMREANARLISAAPELLEALRGLLYLYNEEAIKLAQAAINKAEGGVMAQCHGVLQEKEIKP